MKPSEAITHSQKEKCISSVVESIEEVLKLPEIKDLISEVCISKKDESGESFYFLLTKDGIVVRHEYTECTNNDFFSSKDNQYERRSEDSTITQEDLREKVEFFDLSIEEVILVRDRLK